MRLKIIAGNVLWVLVTGLVAFFGVRIGIADHERRSRPALIVGRRGQ